jgi:hypothetical protein
MIDLKPSAQASHHGCQCFQIARFDKEGGRSKVEGAIHIFPSHRGGQDDNRQSFETRLGAHPGQDIVAVFLWHVEVHQHDYRQGKFVPVAVRAVPFQVGNGLFSVRGLLQRVSGFGVLKGVSHEGAIILAVVHQKDGLLLVHNLPDGYSFDGCGYRQRKSLNHSRLL